MIWNSQAHGWRTTEELSSLLDEVDSRSTAEGFWSRTDNETRLWQPARDRYLRGSRSVWRTGWTADERGSTTICPTWLSRPSPAWRTAATTTPLGASVSNGSTARSRNCIERF